MKENFISQIKYLFHDSETLQCKLYVAEATNNDRLYCLKVI
jgi:hypothetical protein